MPAAGLLGGFCLSLSVRKRPARRPAAGMNARPHKTSTHATYERPRRLRLYSHPELQPPGGSSRHIDGGRIAMTIKRLTGLIALAVAPAIYASSANAPLGTVENKVRHELLML